MPENIEEPRKSRAKRTRIYRVLFLLGFAVLFFVIGYQTRRMVYRARARSKQQVQAPMFNQTRQGEFAQGKYRYINPLLTCEIAEQRVAGEFIDLKNKISSFIDANIKNGNVQKVSVYFDMRDGRWLGVNTSEKYFPASLLKVPTMIAFLKKAENDLDILNKKVVYNGLAKPYNPLRYKLVV